MIRVIGSLDKSKTVRRRQETGQSYTIERKWGSIVADYEALKRYACDETDKKIMLD